MNFIIEVKVGGRWLRYQEYEGDPFYEKAKAAYEPARRRWLSGRCTEHVRVIRADSQRAVHCFRPMRRSSLTP